MEAKDTVVAMDNQFGKRNPDLEKIQQAQAKISFKAGLYERLNDKEIQEALSDARYAGYLSGIKEVVEWGRETCPHDLFGEGTHCFKRACDECWLEQLKKWGIE